MSSTVITEKDAKILSNLKEKVISTKRRRLFAYIVTKIVFILLTILFLSMSNSLDFKQIYSFVFVVIILLSFNLILLMVKEQTVGMLILGMKITSDGTGKYSKKKMVFVRALMNWVIPFIPVINILSLLDYLNITGNSTNRCIHDEFSSAVVVDIKRA